MIAMVRTKVNAFLTDTDTNFAAFKMVTFWAAVVNINSFGKERFGGAFTETLFCCSSGKPVGIA